ncbi:MAG: T9SS type A sorting domain-containing protein [Bacteroidetes bacterium]|nr:MAG: T9SS type A sorting domain-containing protein [Bacteroidota bacterium]
MKKIFTLIAIAFTAISSNSQVIFNEIYTDPSNGNSEFFEFYNSSTSQVPESIDNYTIVTYYEESGKSGFFVMDLPNQTISARSFYVGAPSPTFSIQGKPDITASFSWNLMPTGGSITKWEKSGSGYISVAVPSNLQDFFVKKSGSGAVHHILVFKNGILVNGLFAGNSQPVIPSYFKLMPSLFVDMSGSSPDFTINFSAIADNQVEHETSNTGMDNGYIRSRDGMCGYWVKSSSSASYTPGTSNGSATGTSGTLTVNSYISYGVLPSDPSKLNFSITAGPAEAFPVVIEAYRDLGIIGQLDAADILFYTNTINTASPTVFNTNLILKADKVMLVAKSPAGCYDQVRALNNSINPLPVKLNNFQGNKNKNNVQLQWNVSTNEISNTFEIERSTNGKNFQTAAVMFGTEKAGNETYSFTEMNEDAKVYYRLRMTDKSDAISYSKVLVFNNAASNSKPLNVIGNVVNDKLTFSYESAVTIKAEIRILDMNGKIVAKQTLNTNKGNNLASISMPSSLNNGMYLAVLTVENSNSTAKFIKQ